MPQSERVSRLKIILCRHLQANFVWFHNQTNFGSRIRKPALDVFFSPAKLAFWCSFSLSHCYIDGKIFLRSWDLLQSGDLMRVAQLLLQTLVQVQIWEEEILNHTSGMSVVSSRQLTAKDDQERKPPTTAKSFGNSAFVAVNVFGRSQKYSRLHHYSKTRVFCLRKNPFLCWSEVWCRTSTCTDQNIPAGLSGYFSRQHDTSNQGCWTKHGHSILVLFVHSFSLPTQLLIFRLQATK